MPHVHFRILWHCSISDLFKRSAVVGLFVYDAIQNNTKNVFWDIYGCDFSCIVLYLSFYTHGTECIVDLCLSDILVLNRAIDPIEMEISFWIQAIFGFNVLMLFASFNEIFSISMCGCAVCTHPVFIMFCKAFASFSSWITFEFVSLESHPTGFISSTRTNQPIRTSCKYCANVVIVLQTISIYL